MPVQMKVGWSIRTFSLIQFEEGKWIRQAEGQNGSCISYICSDKNGAEVVILGGSGDKKCKFAKDTLVHVFGNIVHIPPV